MFRIQIIILNLIGVGLSLFSLYTDFQSKGTFQWVDQNAIDDFEELYLNVIAVLIIVGGIISISSQIISGKITSRNKAQKKAGLNYLLNPINFIYGFFILVIGAVFSSGMLINIGNQGSMTISSIILMILLILGFISLCYLGLLILWQLISHDK